MKKNGKRYCDHCGEQMPATIDFSQQDINPHDMISLGRKTKSGQVMDKNYDLCKTCMDELDVFLHRA